MTVRLEPQDRPANFCFDLIDVATGKSLEYAQSDWDYAALARRFGWRPCGEDCATDGTVDCKEHGKKVGQMLAEAFDFLCAHDGEEIDDND